MSVIRQIKQKSGENSFNSYQLGAKASNVQMFDSFNLQQEIVFGTRRKTTTLYNLNNIQWDAALSDPNFKKVFKKYYNKNVFQDVIPLAQQDFQGGFHVIEDYSISKYEVHTFIAKNMKDFLLFLIDRYGIVQRAKKIKIISDIQIQQIPLELE